MVDIRPGQTISFDLPENVYKCTKKTNGVQCEAVIFATVDYLPEAIEAHNKKAHRKLNLNGGN
jgi:hypothetical protein